MEGFEVVTSDDCKIGHVVEVRDGHVIVEHGLLKKTRHAVPETFAHDSEDEEVVRLSVSKETVAEHFGLAESTPAVETEGYGELLPDDPAHGADQDLLRAGGTPADQEPAEIREGGLDADRGGTTTGYLSDRVPPGQK
jgi:hypothetical protein